MGFLTDLIREVRSDSSRVDPVASFLAGEDGYPIQTQSGAYVDEQRSLKVSTVYSCVRLIAWTIASLPLPVYKRLIPRGKERARNHSLYKLLHDAPNSEQTSFEWRSLMSVHQNLWGIGISEIEFDRNGNAIALWPIPPWRVKPMRTADKSLYYRVDIGNGVYKNLPQWSVLTFKALATSIDEIKSPIALHRETVGMAIALKEFGSKTFGQGTNPSGIVTVKGNLNKTSRDSLHESLKGYAGLGGAHRVMLLEEGQDFQRIGLPPEDAQFLETQNFTLAEIARIYNVPLHLLQSHEKSTSWGTGIEEMNLGYVAFTIRPYLVQQEQEYAKKLFIDDDLHFAEYLLDALLRGKLKERYEAYAIGRQWGWLSPDDILELENQNPLPDNQGGIYLVPMNMVNAKYAGENPNETDKTKGKSDAKDAIDNV